MVNYQDIKHGLCDVECLVICLNSLGKLEALDDDELKNYVVYIDEVSSLLEFTSSDLLDTVMKQVVMSLTRIIKDARKVILSDAMLTDGCLELIKSRGNYRCLFFKNEFKKFEGTPAIRMRNAADFLGKLQAHCNTLPLRV